MKKNIIISLVVLIIIMILIPLIINLLLTYEIFGYRPIVSIFNDSQWFSFWYTYIPAILAFSGTLFVVYVTVENNRKIVRIEERNLLLKYMPKIIIIKKSTIERKDLKTIEPSSTSKPNIDSKIHSLVAKLERYKFKYNTNEKCVNVANWMLEIIESFKKFRSTFARTYKDTIGANIDDQVARDEIKKL